MRQIRLVNGNGEALDVTTQEYFMHDLSGFGFDKEFGFRRIGSRYVVLSTATAQSSIEVSMCFASGDPYAQYFKMMQFCKVTPIKLYYTPSKTTYVKDVVLKTVEKAEINEYGVLDVTMTFLGLTPWYREISLYTGVTIDGEATNKFPITFPFTFTPSEAMSITVSSDASEVSPTKLSIYGPAKNPSWVVFTNGVQTSSGKIKDLELSYGDILVVDCSKDPYEIAVYGSSGALSLDAYQKSDFTTERFIWLQPGLTQVKVSSELLGVTVPIKLEAKLFYDSV